MPTQDKAIDWDEPFAWVAFAENGNVRLWTSEESAKLHAESQGMVLEPAYREALVLRLLQERRELVEAARKLVEQCEAEFTLDGRWVNDGQLVSAHAVRRVRTLLSRSTSSPEGEEVIPGVGP